MLNSNVTDLNLAKMVQRAKEQRAIACNHLAEMRREYFAATFKTYTEEHAALEKFNQSRKRAELCTKHLIDLQIMQSEGLPSLLVRQAD